MSEKDPYLSELDDLGEDALPEEGTVSDGEPYRDEATRVDMPMPPPVEDAYEDDLDYSQETALPEENYDSMEPQDSQPLGNQFLDASSEVPLSVVAVMGQTTMSLKEILALNSGQILELEKMPTDPVDLVVGGKVIAKAELVDVDGKLGLRILKTI